MEESPIVLDANPSLALALEGRVKFLEEKLAKYEAGGHVCDHGIQPRETNASQSSHGPISASSNAKTEYMTPINDLTDLLGGLSLGEGNQLRYFGSRSNLSFINSQKLPIASGLGQSVSKSTHHRKLVVDVPSKIQKELLEIFWEWQNPWQYLVHKETFLRSFENNTDDGYCTPLLLYSMLALASRLSDNIDIRIDQGDSGTAGDGFANKAKTLLFEEIEAPRVSTVIAAAHISLKEMAKDNEPAGWTYIGIAVRMAYNLGLHVDPQSCVASGTLSPEEAELRSIAWWGCYMIEKLFTVGIGRPSIILERDIQVPFPSCSTDAEYGQWNPDPDLSLGSYTMLSYPITTFHNACRMLQLAAKPLDDIYAPNQFVSPTEKKSIMTKINVDLVSFYNKTPSVLRLPAPSSPQPVPPHIYCFQPEEAHCQETDAELPSGTYTGLLENSDAATFDPRVTDSNFTDFIDEWTSMERDSLNFNAVPMWGESPDMSQFLTNMDWWYSADFY
ncbi:fungal-specific transcription factor domain-containing protein [Penicillium angulare]|uniref:Fungal-specific transcription factor domain-containing protein n=1 Tax=Penicillium angulare TaxID=116970 RepID=A0A9W9G8C0_9EURO|nr:fungal-specific transcription factor domain-containing protein [Penicillium angulare]